jgi:hypothetical protein
MHAIYQYTFVVLNFSDAPCVYYSRIAIRSPDSPFNWSYCDLCLSRSYSHENGEQIGKQQVRSRQGANRNKYVGRAKVRWISSSVEFTDRLSRLLWRVAINDIIYRESLISFHYIFFGEYGFFYLGKSPSVWFTENRIYYLLVSLFVVDHVNY